METDRKVVANYPFELIHMFMVSLAFNRKSNFADSGNIPIKSEVEMAEPGFPRLQVRLRISTPPENPISFNVEIIALFNFVGENTDYDNKLDKEFTADKALHMLWVYGAQLISMISGQMGMTPIRLKMPMVLLEPENLIETQVQPV